MNHSEPQSVTHTSLLPEVAAKAEADLAKANLALNDALGQVDACALLSCYAMQRILSMRDEVENGCARPAPVAIELAAWLLLPHFGNNDKFDSSRIEIGIDALEKYQTVYALVEAFPPFSSADEVEFDPLDTHLRLHAGLVRGSAYPSLVNRRIEKVLLPFDSELTGLAGIGPGRATKIANAIIRQMDANLHRTQAETQELFVAFVEAASKDPGLSSQLESGLQESVADRGRLWVPTFAEIAEQMGGLERVEWETFASLFGLTAASRPSVNRIVDVQDRPMIFLDSERVFGAHGMVVFDAIFNYFDSLARSTASLRDHYGRGIKNWMEDEIAGFFRRLFPEDSVILSACYPDPDHPAGAETEADVVVLWGPFLIVAEAKGKKVDQDSFRGGLRKLKYAISKNIGDAFEQAQRLVRALEIDGCLQLKERSTGRTIDVDRDSLHRIMPISVTLQHLLGIPTQLAATQRFGLFKGNAYPWSVSIDDLDVITRFSGTPDVFLHFIERRLAHQKLNITLKGDELDIFGHYLDNRLHPEVYEHRKEILNGPSRRLIGFHGGEERFEPFYVSEWYGTEMPTEAVGLKVPDEVGAVLEELRNRTDDNARWIAFTLLGLSDAALTNLADAMKLVRTKAAEGSRIIRTTFLDGNVVVSVLAHVGLTDSKFFKALQERTFIEHYRARTSRAITFGLHQNSPKVFDCALWLDCEWEHDENMEQLLEKDRQTNKTHFLPHNLEEPGRNSPCPCGSGRKFKRCCIGNIRFNR